MHTDEQLQKGILSGFSSGEDDPVLHTSHLRSETQIKKRCGDFYFNNGRTNTAPDKAVATTEQRGGPAQ